MNCYLKFIFAVSIALVQSATAANNASPWENTVVSIEISRKQYDFFQPWNSRMDTSRKNGFVVADKKILTSADALNDRTLVRLQKGGRGKWYNAELTWIDYHANLALLETSDTNFWNGMKPVELADPVPRQGPAQIVRWRSGNLELRKAEITRMIIKQSRNSYVDYMFMEADSEINGAGWSELAIADGKALGLVCAHDNNVCTIIPGPFIRKVLEMHQSVPAKNLGFFNFVWQRSLNPTVLQYLKLPGEPKGVLVVDNRDLEGHPGSLKPRDIILNIAGFDIDTEGNYEDPDYGNLSLEYLSSRRHCAGDEIPITIWREGKQQEVRYRLPVVSYSQQLVPQNVFDQQPEYLMVAGLVFQPLNEPYLRNWGGDWRRRAPFRLMYYTQEKITPERPSRVVLSMVLPDPLNIGYQDYRFLSVDQINGKSISNLRQAAEAFQNPKDGYHMIEFGLGQSPRRMVLDANAINAANKRIMQRYGMDKDREITQAVQP